MRVEDLCRVVTSGGTPSRTKASNFTPATIPWVKTGDLRDGRVHDYDERISEGGLKSSSAKLLPVGTVLMAMYGATVGRLGWLREDAACNQASCAMVADPAVCDPRWLFYALMESRDRLVGLASGAAQQNLNAGVIKAHELPDIRLAEQQAIAGLLGALDDKIAANDRVVAAADELARAEWLAALSGEETRSLSSMARFVNGKAFTKGATGTGRVVIRIAELNSGLGGSTVYNDIDVTDDHLARPGDLLFAWSGSLTAARWYRDEGIVNQHIFKCIPVEGLSVAAVNQGLRSGLTIFKGIAADKATTMGHIQRKHLDLEVLVPEADRLTDVMPRLDALWSAALAAERESSALALTREALLPLLMSGRLRVKDVEHEMAEGL